MGHSTIDQEVQNKLLKVTSIILRGQSFMQKKVLCRANKDINKQLWKQASNEMIKAAASQPLTSISNSVSGSWLSIRRLWEHKVQNSRKPPASCVGSYLSGTPRRTNAFKQTVLSLQNRVRSTPYRAQNEAREASRHISTDLQLLGWIHITLVIIRWPLGTEYLLVSCGLPTLARKCLTPTPQRVKRATGTRGAAT
ncbi:hypothetical protein H105_01257 [Trichophyton soudanense CBS 452.61]|uniref:Uncharacterized protein n=1 Tax=Trichophyton soudanense CBS 452.61 TaxID=1215331 RepID=A0A022Y4F5_TRISD|nr:hypothetical protein H105_01257 [Trichophyton soudanense CBS 452.61]